MNPYEGSRAVVVGGSIGGPFFGKVDQVATNDQSSFLPQSADATEVSERLTDFTGGDTIPALVVAATDDGSALTDVQLSALQTLATEVASIDGVAGEASVDAGPGEGALDDPALELDHEAGVGALDDLHRARGGPGDAWPW